MLTSTTPPDNIRPAHEVRDHDKFNALVASMLADGWQGRPLLVVDEANEGYQALTGSHRLAAALAAELDIVPIAIVEADDLWSDYDLSLSEALGQLESLRWWLEDYDPAAGDLLEQDI